MPRGWTPTRTYSSGRREEVALADFGLGLLAELGAEELSAEYDRQVSNGSIAMLKSWDEEKKILAETADNPSGYQSGFRSRVPKYQQSVLSGATMPRAKRDLQIKLNEKMAEWESAITDYQSMQIAKNRNTDFNLGHENLNESKVYEDPFDMMQNITEGAEFYMGGYGGGVNSVDMVPTEAVMNELIENHTKKTLSNYMMQTGDVENPNAFAEGYGFPNLYNPDEIAEIKSDYLTQNNASSRIAEAKLKALQEETGRQLLSDYWNKKIDGPQTVTDLYEKGLITEQMAKYVRNAILSPDKPFDPLAYKEVKDAIKQMEGRELTEPQVMEIFAKNLISLDEATAKSLINDVVNTRDPYSKRIEDEAYDTMERLIRDVDSMSGMFSGNKKQILGHAQALLDYDLALEDAAKKGKDLSPRDKFVMATEIATSVKNQIEEKPKQKVPEGIFTHQMNISKAGESAIVDPSGKPIGVYNKEEKIVLNEYGFEWLIKWAGSRDYGVLKKFAENNNMIIPE